MNFTDFKLKWVQANQYYMPVERYIVKDDEYFAGELNKLYVKQLNARRFAQLYMKDIDGEYHMIQSN